MSTRSRIAVVDAPDKVLSIYCHSDGYIEGNGICLHEYYNSKEKALDIIKQNDCSYLSSTIEESRFYNTWRGDITEALRFYNIEDCLDHAFFRNEFSGIEYMYIWMDSQWFVKAGHFLGRSDRTIGQHTLIKLEDAISYEENRHEREENEV